MPNTIVAVRQLTVTSLSWFKEARNRVNNNERGININGPVRNKWFPQGMQDPTLIQCKYLQLDDDFINPRIIFEASRPINRQGGDKNTRLTGDAIPGEFYGTMRVGDLMIMSFNQGTNTLAWLVVRGHSTEDRTVSSYELRVYDAILSLLGNPNADRSMWLPNAKQTSELLSQLERLYPNIGVSKLLMDQLEMYFHWNNNLNSAGYSIPRLVDTADTIDVRLFVSLKAKRFVILTGLAGSGKTVIARAFAQWLSESPEQFAIIPVGADWTNRDPIFGYANALDNSRYESTPALSLILRAVQFPSKPHFLILDEMNLSHVERYFADVLSAIESDAPIILYEGPEERANIPKKIERLPPNLFIIGTVNIDETTYMFSPKVLDRANVIEFRASANAIDEYLNRGIQLDIEQLRARGSAFADQYVMDARRAVWLDPDQKARLAGELIMFFSILARHGMEFGFRTVSEIERYIFYRMELQNSHDTVGNIFRLALDAQIFQKLLPRLHGSRRKLEPILLSLATLCWARTPEATPDQLLDIAYRAGETQSYEDILDQSNVPHAIDGAYYPLSYEKITRMLRRLEDGFTSFAEA
jgi:MoxR-like ATPase